MVCLWRKIGWRNGRFYEVGNDIQDTVVRDGPFLPVEGNEESVQCGFVGKVAGFDSLPQALSTCPFLARGGGSIVRL